MHHAAPRPTTTPTLMKRLTGFSTRLPQVAVVVAHPDDEVIAAGGQLAHLPGVQVVHVTDGAPLDPAAAQRAGCASRAEYTATRRRERAHALALAGIGAGQVHDLDVPDQGAAERLPSLARRLATLLDELGTELVITHAYEGGHPDHDATAFAVHAAVSLLREQGAPAPRIAECPLYHERQGEWATARFTDGGPAEIAVLLDPAERQRKARLLACYRTQRHVLTMFGCEVERFRPAPAHDFGVLPNGGTLLYERYPWGMTGDRWLELVHRARRELALVEAGA